MDSNPYDDSFKIFIIKQRMKMLHIKTCGIHLEQYSEEKLYFYLYMLFKEKSEN